MAGQRQGRARRAVEHGVGNETHRLSLGVLAPRPRLSRPRRCVVARGAAIAEPDGPVDRPAAAALRQPEDRPGQPARGSLEGPRYEMGVPARRPAGRNHRGIRHLAQGARFRGRGGLGAALPALRPPHRAGRLRARKVRCSRSTFSPRTAPMSRRHCNRASSPTSKVAMDHGAWSTGRASRATLNRSRSGASIPMKRSNSRARARRPGRLRRALDAFDEDDFGQRARPLRLETLVRLRWLAAAGQIAAMLVAYFGLGVRVSARGPLLCVGASVALNVWLRWRFPSATGSTTISRPICSASTLLQLAVLLLLSGRPGQSVLDFLSRPADDLGGVAAVAQNARPAQFRARLRDGAGILELAAAAGRTARRLQPPPLLDFGLWVGDRPQRDLRHHLRQPRRRARRGNSPAR